MNKKNLIFTLLISLFLSLTAQTTQQLKVYDDTYLYKGTSGTGDEIKGLEPFLYTYHSTAGSQYRRETFLRFDISSLSTYLSSVKFRVYADALPEAHTFNLYPLTKTTWVEDDLTFNNKAIKAGADIATVFTTASGPIVATGQYYDFDVTSIVKDSISKGAQFIGFRLRDATVVKTLSGGASVVNWHSKENPSGNYPMFQYVEEDISALKLQTLSIDGNPLSSFTSTKYKYNVILPWNANVIPIITAVAVENTSTVVITPATSLTGNETTRTTKIVVTNATVSLTYNVVFQLLPPPTVADISNVTIGGKSIDNFSINTTSYTVNVPFNWDASSAVVAQKVDQTATYQVTPPSNLKGTDSDKTMIITCTSANGQVSKKYNVLINVLPELDIILAMGQSQMGGRASFANEGTAPIPDVYLLTPGLFVEPATNPLNRYANITKDASLEALSPAYSFLKKLQPLVNRPIGIMVNAQGGSSITSWYQPGKPNYDASLKRIKEIMKYGTVKGIIWHQGSADNSAAVADNFVTYKANFNTMVTNFRKDLGLPDLFFICGELSDGRPEFDAFNLNIIQAVKSYIPNSDYIMATGTTLLSDGIHWDEPSVVMMGERYADKFLANVYSSVGISNIKNGSFDVISNGRSLTIFSKESTGKILISDTAGRVVAQHSLQINEKVKFDFIPGFYVLVLSSDKYKKVYKVKF